MKDFLKGGGTILVVIALLAMRLTGQYNVLVSLDEGVKKTWANVEGQYQRRADLIPSLVNTVQGFADQELSVFLKTVEERSNASQTTVNLEDPASIMKFQQAQGEVSSMLSRLLVTVEAYPDLKSNENFLDLQKQLEGTENRIAVARGKYNEAVRDYNVKVRRFPTNMIAGYFGFDGGTMFEADQGAETAPSVDFDTK